MKTFVHLTLLLLTTFSSFAHAENFAIELKNLNAAFQTSIPEDQVKKEAEARRRRVFREVFFLERMLLSMLTEIPKWKYTHVFCDGYIEFELGRTDKHDLIRLIGADKRLAFIKESLEGNKPGDVIALKSSRENGRAVINVLTDRIREAAAYDPKNAELIRIALWGLKKTIHYTSTAYDMSFGESYGTWHQEAIFTEKTLRTLNLKLNWTDIRLGKY